MKRILPFILILVLGIAPMYSQEASSLRSRLFESQIHEKSTTVETEDFVYIPKKPGHYSAEDWHEVLDSMYGQGLPISEKLKIFDEAWKIIDEKFAGFHGLNLDWNAIKEEYRPRIADTINPISQGRFYAILNHMILPLKTTGNYVDYKNYLMSNIYEYPLNERHGLPIFNSTGRYRNTHFGAGLTALKDSSLLVIKAFPNHPIGLVPGDIVLGYDGIPWKTLYKEVLNAELILDYTQIWGGTDYSITHNLLTSAGMNWHLFDTIDIVKYPSGDTLHYSVGLLAGQDRLIYGNEQLKLDGVSWPDTLKGDISWGFLDSTKIGYIYAVATLDHGEMQFYNAIYNLMHNHDTKGLIIDVRANYGGNYINFNKGLSLLFDKDVKSISFDKRCGDPGDHFRMCPDPFIYNIEADPDTYYNKPIAVLTGPGAISTGGHLVHNLTKHPMVKTFGKNTPAGFVGETNTKLVGSNDWTMYYASSIAFTSDEQKNYLIRKDLRPDSAVWFTQETVAQGIDNVVKAAKEWIDGIVGFDGINYEPSGYFVYPNPTNHSITIETEYPKQARIKIMQLDGKEVFNGTMIGRQTKINLSEFSSGIYLISIRTKDYVWTKKFVKL